VASAGRGLREPPSPASSIWSPIARGFEPRRSALIFAGGRASRLGGVNKALLDVGGRSIVTRILDALEPLVDESVVLANDSTLSELGRVRLILDPSPHAGVLPALAAGLEAAAGELCLAVACDMPFVSAALFAHLLELQAHTDADVVIPRTTGFLEPMHAVYRRAPVLSAIQGALARGEQRMISYLADVRVREVSEPEWRAVDTEGTAFFNVNTPEDLAEARRLDKTH
jgi:molybdopterin-guanine dinucleotide biosynthesis protein A